jgi:predicted dienelactone hydrolase
MKPISLLMTAALCAWPLAAQTASAEGPVGAITIEMDNNSRKFPVELWYEPVSGAKVEELSFRAPLRPTRVARGTDPRRDVAKRPLIAISHGNWGTRYSQGWLALKLVNAGYVVLSTSHPGTLADDQTVAGRFRLWDRAVDVSFVLDRILNDPKWAPLIDGRRIGFVGHSFGGWAGASLAGGRYDPVRQRAFCENSAKKDFYCDNTLKDDVSAVQAADADRSFQDARIRAYYIMGSGPGQGFSEESLKAISAPFVVDTAELDEILDPRANSGTLATLISGAKEIKRSVGHFAYVPECRSIIGPILARVAGIPICNDPDGVDRAAVHQHVARDVIQFFNTELHVDD